MAVASVHLIDALRSTRARLRGEAAYQWGHMGMCNCGHLAQTVTQLDKKTIHASAMVREGDWREQLREYCPSSGLQIDLIIRSLLDTGLSIHDIASLEALDDERILRRVGRPLRRNQKDDLDAYLGAWIELLELELAAERVAQAA